MHERSAGWWPAPDLVEAVLAAGVLAVLVWAADERARLRGLLTPDAPTYRQATALLSRVWRCARSRASRTSSVLFPYLAVWV